MTVNELERLSKAGDARAEIAGAVSGNAPSRT
jgi:hypothetical protein